LTASAELSWTVTADAAWCARAAGPSRDQARAALTTIAAIAAISIQTAGVASVTAAAGIAAHTARSGQ